MKVGVDKQKQIYFQDRPQSNEKDSIETKYHITEISAGKLVLKMTFVY